MNSFNQNLFKQTRSTHKDPEVPCTDPEVPSTVPDGPRDTLNGPRSTLYCPGRTLEVGVGFLWLEWGGLGSFTSLTNLMRGVYKRRALAPCDFL